MAATCQHALSNQELLGCFSQFPLVAMEAVRKPLLPTTKAFSSEPGGERLAGQAGQQSSEGGARGCRTAGSPVSPPQSQTGSPGPI